MNKNYQITRQQACYCLGVKIDADLETIKRAYRYKAKLYHPDSNPYNDTSEYYIMIQKAYEYLVNNPYIPSQNISPCNGYGYSGQNIYGNKQNMRPVKIYQSDENTRKRYQAQKDNEKERAKVLKWEAEYRANKKHAELEKRYGKNQDNNGIRNTKSKEEEALEKIRAIWIAETIKRQIEMDKKQKEIDNRRKIYQAFMQQKMNDEKRV